MGSGTFRFKIHESDTVEVTDHALQRYWLRIDKIPDRVEVEKRIKSELGRGFWVRHWRIDEDGKPVLYARCSGIVAVITPLEAGYWKIITVMGRKKNERYQQPRRYKAGKQGSPTILPEDCGES
jgi:hypothetical protein